jgi:hypothetical protein
MENIIKNLENEIKINEIIELEQNPIIKPKKEKFDPKKYYQNNKDKFKEYYKIKKEKIKEKSTEKLYCDICNCDYGYTHTTQHNSSTKHKNSILINLIQKQQESNQILINLIKKHTDEIEDNTVEIDNLEYSEIYTI